MKLIVLSNRKVAIVDNEDYWWLRWGTWCVKPGKNTYYAHGKLNGKACLMHRLIWEHHYGALGNLLIDHINHFGFDNRKCNLRSCTNSQSLANRRPRRNAKSKYKGVWYHPKAKKWQAAISFNKKTYRLGYYANQIDAARAYDKAALKIHGRFAFVNLPVDTP